MRLLVVTHHFYEPSVEGDSAIYASKTEPFARIAAVNAMIVAFHRHFGPYRHGVNPNAPFPNDETRRSLDIVVLQVPGKGIMEHVGIDPSLYTLELWDGPPMMLGFETQRVIRERLGQYDYYAVVEDDMVIHDPLFFEKLAWFESSFGINRVLLPLRYEISQSGRPALVSAWPIISSSNMLSNGLRRPNQQTSLSATWHGRQQNFELPTNPHIGGFFVSDAQLRKWVSSEHFYDRDTSFVGPLESAMVLSLGRDFDVYQPAAPDPFFLSIEHWGTRYARMWAPPGVVYGDTPLLEIVRGVLSASKDDKINSFSSLAAASDSQLNKLLNERDLYRHELSTLQKSPKKLLKALGPASYRRIERELSRIMSKLSLTNMRKRLD